MGGVWRKIEGDVILAVKNMLFYFDIIKFLIVMLLNEL